MIDDYDASIVTASVGAAGMWTTPDADDEDENIAQSLLKSCVERVETGEYFVTALELVLIVLNVVHEIANGNGYDYDGPQVSGDISYATHVFKAFSQKVAKQRNNNFMYMLTDQVNNMTEEDNLSGEELRKAYKEYLDLKS